MLGQLAGPRGGLLAGVRQSRSDRSGRKGGIKRYAKGKVVERAKVAGAIRQRLAGCLRKILGAFLIRRLLVSIHLLARV